MSIRGTAFLQVSIDSQPAIGIISIFTTVVTTGFGPVLFFLRHFFNDLGLTIERSQREYRGVRSTTDWLIGLDATVNSHGQSLIVTRDTLKEFESDEARIDGELKHIREKIVVARNLCEVEQEVNRLKALRTDLRHQYETMLD